MGNVTMIDHEAETQEMPAVVAVKVGTCVDCGRDILQQAGQRFGGYGKTAGGDFVCPPCCGYRTKGDMIQDGDAWLYLTMGKDSKGSKGSVGDWLGVCNFPAMNIRKGRHNMARVRYDVWFVGPDGFVWHGTQYGDNTQLVRVRRTRQRWTHG